MKARRVQQRVPDHLKDLADKLGHQSKVIDPETGQVIDDGSDENKGNDAGEDAGGKAEGEGGDGDGDMPRVIVPEPLGPGTKFHPLISSLDIADKLDLFTKLVASMTPDQAARSMFVHAAFPECVRICNAAATLVRVCVCLVHRSQDVVIGQFIDMNLVDRERVIVPLLEHMDQGAKCRLITCPFHNHGRDPRALSEDELQAAILAAQKDAEAKAEADAEEQRLREEQELRESVAGQKLRRWLKKRGAVGGAPHPRQRVDDVSSPLSVCLVRVCVCACVCVWVRAIALRAASSSKRRCLGRSTWAKRRRVWPLARTRLRGPTC